MHAMAAQLLERHGVVTREAVLAESVAGGFAGVYGVLRALEERGTVRRGYFVTGLGAAQFALPGAVDRLRSDREADDVDRAADWDAGGGSDADVVVLAATDPAQIYGAALPWPETDGRPSRSAGAVVVQAGGHPLVWFDTRSHHLVGFVGAHRDPRWAEVLATIVPPGSRRKAEVRKIDGGAVESSHPLAAALLAAGFVESYRGLVAAATQEGRHAMAVVMVLGSLNLDLVTRVARHPTPGETVLGDGLERLPGGKGANQVVAAAAAGARAAMVGRVGDDDAGHAYLARLKKFGVDVRGVHVTSGSPTGHALIAVSEDGENTIVVIPGANGEVGEGDLGPVDALGPGDVLLVQLELPLDVVAAGVRRAAARGVRVVLNVAPYAALPADVLALADPVVANEHEAELLAKDGAAPAVPAGDPGRRRRPLGRGLGAQPEGRGGRHHRRRRRLLRRPRRRPGRRVERRGRPACGGGRRRRSRHHPRRPARHPLG